MKYFLSTIFLSFCLALGAQEISKLLSGPMLGYSEKREVALWVQTNQTAKIQFQYWEKNNPGRIYSTATYQAEKSGAFTVKAIVDSVEPGRRYEYRLLIDGIETPRDYLLEFQSQPMWMALATPPDFTMVAGSCAYIHEEKYEGEPPYYGSEYEIFTSIYGLHPDFMLWLGDNFYLREPDWNSWTGMVKRYTHGRSLPQMQPMLASIHQYAIWDDHDFGPNDCDRSFWNKENSLKLFSLFWPNPSVGVAGIDGAITQFQWGDVDFFLLDDRYYRSPDNLIAENKTQLGEAQKQWLKDVLAGSKATFKVIALGGQFLNTAGAHETYLNYGFGKERQEIIDFIYRQNIKNVVFLTGDRHATELSILKEKNHPRILDLTVSALTSGPADNESENNTLRVAGTYVKIHNFATLNFSGTLENRILLITVYDKDGKTCWQKNFNAEK